MTGSFLRGEALLCSAITRFREFKYIRLRASNSSRLNVTGLPGLRNGAVDSGNGSWSTGIGGSFLPVPGLRVGVLRPDDTCELTEEGLADW